MFADSFNDIIDVVYPNLFENNDTIKKYIVTTFPSKVNEINPDNLFKMFSYSTEELIKLIDYYPWEKIIKYYKDRSTTIYHKFINYVPNDKKLCEKILNVIINIDKEELNQYIFFIIREDYKGYIPLDEIKAHYSNGEISPQNNIIMKLYNNINKRRFIQSKEIINGISFLVLKE